ncbi:HKD family nuclease [Flavobacterium gillisiae]|uniref:HKD family nuclease n=1 Tax=Flavobacterium gillisiae TaxID=150146 RepID=A0A1H4D833_9FLAO|nr:phospholipase D family protein [Flavobacterium gillisiae]SEA68422.1 HKD family nuclease [Flavobacterium gillisiae]
MKLLSNNEIVNHKTEISNAIELAEEITICTAFLKYSGLKSLLELINQKKTKTIFFVGTNFYQTEPSALKQLFNDGHTIYLNREKSPTFHPKIFLFRTQNEVKVFIGSANLTSGGLETNIETSIESNTTIDSILYNDILEQLSYFRTKSKRIERLETILDYEKRYKVYKEKHQIADKAFEKEEQKIAEAERKREEERLLKIEQEKEKRKNPASDSDTSRDRFAISDDYKKSWPLFFEEFKQFKIENNGNTIIPTSHKLHNWYKRQREFYGHIDENGIRAILPEHLELLNKENFFWGNPNEIIWMEKWENKLARLDTYCKSINQEFAWIKVDKKNKQNPLNDLAQWCMDQRLRLAQLENEKNYKTKKRKITEYEIKRLKEIKFLTESENEGGVVNQDGFIQHLIDLENLKNKCLKAGIRRWIPSQTDPDPIVAELGGWLADNLTFIRNHTKKGTKPELVKSRSKDLKDLGIDTIIGKEKNNFEFDVLDWLEMKKLYPIENPKGEARKPFVNVLNWESGQRNKYGSAQPWKQKRLVELKIVKLQSM